MLLKQKHIISPKQGKPSNLAPKTATHYTSKYQLNTRQYKSYLFLQNKPLDNNTNSNVLRILNIYSLLTMSKLSESINSNSIIKVYFGEWFYCVNL